MQKSMQKVGGRHSLARPLAESTRHHSCSIRRNLVLIRPCLKRRFFGYEILKFFCGGADRRPPIHIGRRTRLKNADERASFEHQGGNVTSAGWQVTLCDPT